MYINSKLIVMNDINFAILLVFVTYRIRCDSTHTHSYQTDNRTCIPSKICLTHQKSKQVANLIIKGNAMLNIYIVIYASVIVIITS